MATNLDLDLKPKFDPNLRAMLEQSIIYLEAVAEGEYPLEAYTAEQIQGIASDLFLCEVVTEPKQAAYAVRYMATHPKADTIRVAINILLEAGADLGLLPQHFKRSDHELKREQESSSSEEPVPA